MRRSLWTRRDALIASAALGVAPLVGRAEERTMIKRSIPASNERLPVIGLGTYMVFDIDSTPAEMSKRREIMELLTSLNRDQGITILMVTHEPDMAEYADRLVRFVDGKVETDARNEKAV